MTGPSIGFCGRPWTAAEDQALIDGDKAGIPIKDTAQQINRTVAACKHRCGKFRDQNTKWTPEIDARMTERREKGWSWQRIADAEGRTMNACICRLKTLRGRAAIQRARQAQDEAIRAEAYRSVTAYVCGDPLPGRSALDQRREGR